MATMWAMPEWMRPYVRFIGDTGGNPIDELMNDHHVTIKTNAVRVLLCIAVCNQVRLLERLYAHGLLKENK